MPSKCVRYYRRGLAETADVLETPRKCFEQFSKGCFYAGLSGNCCAAKHLSQRIERKVARTKTDQSTPLWVVPCTPDVPGATVNSKRVLKEECLKQGTQAGQVLLALSEWPATWSVLIIRIIRHRRIVYPKYHGDRR